jgi:NADPH2:quinone reductase
VAVDVKAVGLNFFDTLIIEGKYQVKPPLPFSPGGEFAGLAGGRRVMGFCGYGAAREKITVPLESLATIPGEVSFEIAACLPIAYGTAMHALADRAALKPGETVAVLGASGGTGQAAVELAKLMGARVIACVSSEDKAAHCRALGADEVIIYGQEDLKARLRALTGSKGPEVIFDPVGGDLTEPAVRAIAWGGRFLVIGFAGGDIPRLPLNLPLLKGCDIRGVYWGEHVNREPARHRANMERLLAWTAEGRLKPHIHARYTLEEIGEALRALKNREVKGKAILAL